GPVSDAVRAALVDWYGYLEAQIRHAVAGGEIDADAETLAFELVALNEEANARSLLMDDERPYALAAAAIRARLRAAGAAESAVSLL
ncbi:TetR family transcriptional regulator C-terminal domain-containing protein, partial [Shewanella colwelliana]|uniref:TetR family transcriptional regulator C-terminal domain-containing protein n=1 Tax=Shewanella colwelliana TaxID=23 RepID=UPI0022B07496